MRRSAFAAGIVAALITTGCAVNEVPRESGTPQKQVSERLKGALWVRYAAEYDAITEQTYHLARLSFDDGVADPAWTAALEQRGLDYQRLPTAVVVDVDETVLDNSPFQARLVAADTDFSQDIWQQWVEEEGAEPVPGALRFLRYVHSVGTVVFYVTNRVANNEAHTRSNLHRWGFPLRQDMDVVLSRGENGWTSDKTSRRAALASRYRIVLLVGDDINDFVFGARTHDPQSRLALVRAHDGYWGSRWIVLPNPLYGSWEASLTEREPKLTVTEESSPPKK